MNKSIIILLLILVIVSCEKTSKTVINESNFNGKTFSLKWETQKDTFAIEFQDSTYIDLKNLRDGNQNWSIAEYNNSNFLILGNRTIGIEKINNETYNCTYIGLSGNTFTMTERKSKWNRNRIIGTWVKKEYDEQYDYSVDESIPKPPPPPAPPGIPESKYHWPPYFQITKDSIKLFEYYSVHKSAFELNKTNEFLLMELGNDNINEKNWQWNINSLSENTMIIERRVSELFSVKYVSDTLIRKKR